ncbi:SubName: Full=Related to DOT5-involved in derepression of telomeric silencing {ECO:0000313/EMBL:CCA71350.1} [Serendipita indica DSM 11827]|nr:SubName: Full=Related to DOT5-involved in derepression of telomeric silencing {ECO:0000313/EMBL:CCA71350.1} [Serendipita indica DSM 11827]
MPEKPAPAPTAPKPVKRAKKVDPELSEWKPTKKTASKKRKKADDDVEDKEGQAVEEETKPKKKVKKSEETKEPAEEAKASTTTRTERRRSGAVTVQPTIEEGSEGKTLEENLVVGSFLPDLTLHKENGDEINLNTLASQTGVVIFAAPKADTPGCNKQSCHFRDSAADFRELGYTVWGLTSDSPKALSRWQEKNKFGYSLLSDPERKFIKMLGALNGTSTKRSHFVFEKGTGKLLNASIGVKPDESHRVALEFVKSL